MSVEGVQSSSSFQEQVQIVGTLRTSNLNRYTEEAEVLKDTMYK